MKKKILSVIGLIILVLFSGIQSVYAAITSEEEINYKIEQLGALAEFDFLSMINKSEVVGLRLDNYKMVSQFYVNTIVVTADNLSNILDQIEIVKNSADFSDTEKKLQINKLYRQADLALYELDTKTMTYLMDLRSSIPSVSYKTFIGKFQELYNSLELSGNSLNLE